MTQEVTKTRSAEEGPRRLQAKDPADATALRAELTRRGLPFAVEEVSGAVFLVVPAGANPLRGEEVIRHHELAQAVARLRAASTQAGIKEAAAVCFEYALGLR